MQLLYSLNWNKMEPFSTTASETLERFVSRLKYPQNRFGSEKHESEIS